LAQDHLYSQFYNAPNYLNPALNGQFDGDLRMNFIYRSQWTNLPGPLNYYTFSVDLNVPKLNGGLGLMVTRSSEGTAYLSKTNVSGIYSYSVEFDNSVLSFGLQAGFTNRKIDADKLVFLDQLNDQGIIPGTSPSATANPEFNNKYYFDPGAGINFVKGDFMIGTSAQHINKPNESFTGTSANLPMRINAYASYMLPLNPFDDPPSIIPSVVFANQAGITSFSAGAQLKYRSANIGFWYRDTGQQSDAFVVSVIFDLFGRNNGSKTRLGISHDATTSQLQYTKTAGTTEGAISFETTLPRRDGSEYFRSSSTKRCYDFY